MQTVNLPSTSSRGSAAIAIRMLLHVAARGVQSSRTRALLLRQASAREGSRSRSSSCSACAPFPVVVEADLGPHGPQPRPSRACPLLVQLGHDRANDEDEAGEVDPEDECQDQTERAAEVVETFALALVAVEVGEVGCVQREAVLGDLEQDGADGRACDRRSETVASAAARSSRVGPASRRSAGTGPPRRRSAPIHPSRPRRRRHRGRRRWPSGCSGRSGRALTP